MSAVAENRIVRHGSAWQIRRVLRRRSTLAFCLCVPLLLLVAGLVIWPSILSVWLSFLNKAETKFVGLGNYLFLLKRETFWMVVQQSVVFTVLAVFFKAVIGLITAHLINHIPNKGQRKWRGMLMLPWVIPLALGTLGWWWLYDPSYSALNWIVESLGFDEIPFLAEPNWARASVILVNIWAGAPFFMIMYLAALKSIPHELYEAADIDGANAWQKLWYVTLPMMKSIIGITVMFSTIVTFANFDIVRILTQGGPRNTTHMFATYAFKLGIESGDVPLGAAVSLFMFPALLLFAILILRMVRRRAQEI